MRHIVAWQNKIPLLFLFMAVPHYSTVMPAHYRGQEHHSSGADMVVVVRL